MMTAEEYIAKRGGVLVNHDSRPEGGGTSHVYGYMIGDEPYLLGFAAEKGLWIDGPQDSVIPDGAATSLVDLLAIHNMMIIVDKR